MLEKKTFSDIIDMSKVYKDPCSLSPHALASVDTSTLPFGLVVRCPLFKGVVSTWRTQAPDELEITVTITPEEMFIPESHPDRHAILAATISTVVESLRDTDLKVHPWMKGEREVSLVRELCNDELLGEEALEIVHADLRLILAQSRVLLRTTAEICTYDALAD